MTTATLQLYGLPVLFAVGVWWLSTGIIIYLDNLPRFSHRWSMAAASVVLVMALRGLYFASAQNTVLATYAAFAYGLLVWGWQEMSFFMGFITGPVREPCPPDCTGWPCFVRALKACLYHEVACLAFGGAIIWLTYGAVNQVGAWTYGVLWLMRMSAKLNVLLGVRNLSEEFIPEHLMFIRSFLRQRPMNLLFPFSVTFGTIATFLVAQRAGAPHVTAAEATGAVFIAVLLFLAVIEHWFLVLPISVAALWNWSLARGSNAGEGTVRAASLAMRPRWRRSTLAPLALRMTPQIPVGDEP
jgi:putative photosynthetic complex assembly protein 2